MREIHKFCQLANRINDHKINIDQKRYIKSCIDRPIPRTTRPHTMDKKSQERLYSNRNSLLNYHRESQQSNYLQYHRFRRPKRDVEQTDKYLQQDRLKSSLLNSPKAL